MLQACASNATLVPQRWSRLWPVLGHGLWPRRDSNIGLQALPLKAFQEEAVFSFPYLFPDSFPASVNTVLAADSAIKQYPIAFQAALFLFSIIRARRTQIIDQTDDELGPKFEGGEDSTCSPMWSALEGLQDVVIHRAPKSAHR